MAESIQLKPRCLFRVVAYIYVKISRRVRNFLSFVRIRTSVTSIAAGAFINYKNLTGALIIPSTVTSIGAAAFVNCSGLTAISYKQGTVIDTAAFAGCVTPTTY